MAKTESNTKSKPIVVAGDVTIDWLEVGTLPDETDGAYNWRTYPGTRQIARPGGALLLADFVKAASDATVIPHELADIESIPPEKIIHSIAVLEKFPYSTSEKDTKNKLYRISQHKGFAGIEHGRQFFAPIKGDIANPAVVVLDDPGNGFRTEDAVWPVALKKGGKPLVIFKISRPFSKSPLWTLLQKEHAERLIIVVSGDDLRREGAKISRRLSWERTARDFVWQMSCNPHLMALNSCAYLIVRFGVDGAILYRRRTGTVESILFYDPKVEEDGFRDDYPGTMQGLSSAFVAALTGCLYRKGIDTIGEGVREGIRSSRLLWQLGFGNNLATLNYPVKEIFNQSGPTSITDIVIPNPSAPGNADPDFWCIANELTKRGMEDAARNYVLNGNDPVLDRVPAGRFRGLVTIDRSEIESYRSIRNLIREYLDGNKSGNPLSIAVFGKPGSGKSFGVTEVAESVAPGRIENKEFNLSQFESTEDLIAAFHKVRDIALGNKVPIVFFDEFDSDFHGRLGWLKYFLSPMQDGKFRDGETSHPIGRAIFVFAGGTCSTFEEFSGEKDCSIKTAGSATPTESEVAEDSRKKAFKEVKGPDFVSRLRGFVNIKGPDPTDGDDTRYMLRRAILLRSLLSRKAKHLIDHSGRLAIDEGILRALLKIPEYKHGVRSMTAIMEMSLLAGRKSFEQAALPSPEQLELQVDADMFYRLVMRNVLLGGEREKIAQAIHKTYLKDQKAKKITGKPALVPWNKLDEAFRESNRQQADHIPTKLNAIRCSFAPVRKGVKPDRIRFTKPEIKFMAEMEHERWNSEKFLAGWSYGKVRKNRKLIHPNLVEWDKLPNKIKDYDRDTVRAMPAILAKAGFEIFRV
ncbi:MAG: AAA family ATPase [Desulfomonile tiedjei]|uniref:AAA family ATPase n=1 Tax=Desulfomonile tiedjei TaxID=2358 RepID=A0A9D6V0I4_9BACT|nr:AAA family ATPase [Desulfomonile tiedjei]